MARQQYEVREIERTKGKAMASQQLEVRQIECAWGWRLGHLQSFEGAPNASKLGQSDYVE